LRRPPRRSFRAAALKGQQDAERCRLQSEATAIVAALVAVLGDGEPGHAGAPRPFAQPKARKARPHRRRAARPRRGGNYRTLCVRSPATASSSRSPPSAAPSDFARDERTCQMMCPGTQTALYFHLCLQGQESEDMVSARTRAALYGDAENAFAYRNADAHR
jgi:hypothetical protein